MRLVDSGLSRSLGNEMRKAFAADMLDVRAITKQDGSKFVNRLTQNSS